MNDIERNLRRRLKKAIRKRTELNNKVLEYQKEIHQLEDNWNKLKEYLFDIRKRGFALQNLANVTKTTEPNIAILIIINKMQEIEGSDSNERRI